MRGTFGRAVSRWALGNVLGPTMHYAISSRSFFFCFFFFFPVVVYFAVFLFFFFFFFVFFFFFFFFFFLAGSGRPRLWASAVRRSTIPPGKAWKLRSCQE